MSQSLESVYEAIMQRRDQFLPALHALAEEAPHSRRSRDLRKLIDQLSGDERPEDLIENPILADWLPILAAEIESDTAQKQLGDLIDRYSVNDTLRHATLFSFAYPIFLFLMAGVLFIGAAAIVMPSFADMYQEFGLNLPTTTKALVGISEFIHQRPIEFAVIAAGIVMMMVGVTYLWTHFGLTGRWFPFLSLGNTRSLLAMSRFSGNLADLLAVDLSLADAIAIAGQGVRHHQLQQAARSMAQHAADSNESMNSFNFARYMPDNVLLAISAEGKPNIELLNELSTLYAERASLRYAWRGSFAAILGVLAIGAAMIGFIGALFAPFTNLISGMS